MVSKSLFKAIKESPQKYITRYHTTRFDHIPSILDKGLVPTIGSQQLLSLTPDKLKRASFTATNESMYPPSYKDLQYQLRFRIPKEEYRRLRRISNPETGEGFTEKLTGSDDSSNQLYSILEHDEHPKARTDVFEDELKPEWVDRICVGDMNNNGKNKCFDSLDEYRKYNIMDFLDYDDMKKVLSGI